MKRQTDYPTTWAQDVVEKLWETHTRGCKLLAANFGLSAEGMKQLLEKMLSEDQLVWRVMKEFIHREHEFPKGTPKWKLWRFWEELLVENNLTSVKYCRNLHQENTNWRQKDLDL
jgi:hypothetical protein